MRFFVFTMLLAFLLSLAGCQPAAPAIKIEPAAQDLGERSQQRIELTYTVSNTGGSPLAISKITTSCECTKATLDRMDIPAGESALLRVTLDPLEDNLYGNILRVVYLRSNDPVRPEVEAEFRVTIQKPES
jgi:hypothetical protein